jgi:D-3-phosphoglycerate dehydrogenase / 2-oxoglutarate reductase
MKKIKIGISKEIDFKFKLYQKKKFQLNKIDLKKFFYDAILITSNSKIDYKIINNCKSIQIIFIISLHLLSKIKLKKLRKDIKILYFNNKSKKVIDSITATPEFIFGLIILLTKHFLQINETLKKNIWDPRQVAELTFNKMLSQSTLGIVGYGRIGKKLASIAKHFGMKILIFTRKNNLKLNDLAKKSDIISINLSLNKKTKNIINKNFFSKMKTGSYFINTSKGDIVNYNDLLIYLKKNIKGAAIDVYKNENSNDKEIIKLINYSRTNNNLILTPHIAGSTLDSILTLQKHCLNRIESVIKI